MNQKKLLYLVIFVLTVFSCGKDDGPSAPDNTAPVITNTTKTFTVAENISDTFVIGSVTATDVDTDDTLTFSIATNSDNLFEISATGALSLTAGKTLNATTKSSHALSIGVNDGTVTTKANFTINVTQAVATNETPVIQAQSFEVAENIADTEIFATVVAADADNDQADLTFSMVQDNSGHFDITPTGGLKLGDGESLDFATPEHTITVSVSDGNTAAQAEITITVTEANGAPIIVAQSFEAAETIADDVVIGTVLATDPEQDALTFAITTNDNDLFEITADGKLSLADGKSLDEETDDLHEITVSVDDNNGNLVEANITITVLDRFEDKATDPEWFVTTWETANDALQVAIEVNPETYTYDFIVDWGDGTVEETPEFIDSDGIYFEHTYGTASDFTMAIKGEFPYFDIYYPGMFQSLEQWGDIQWKSFESTFNNTFFLYNATDVPNLSQTTSMVDMFRFSNFNGDVSGWETGNVTYMTSMFKDNIAFEGNGISAWDVSKVTDMSFMFSGTTLFNQNLNSWDVSNVTNMQAMFNDATAFNGFLNGWGLKTGNVTNMDSMFNGASSFNRGISGWDVSSVTTMRYMFIDAISFNQSLGAWDVSAVEDMRGMFSGASAFNQNLGAWNISSVTNMSNMLNNSGLSRTNYDNTLIGWSGPNAPANIALGATGLTFCNALNERSYLTGINKGWTITGDAYNCN
ncbi:BspA family leucine-rich repeat surface protein [Flagellimonas iocasae]|uniref:BspA family leucine-rich repeat surface protein n=1 Tax=Flagellimonas iocasae TaxID=2055905 RepID=A0ABW4XVU3_9FLAO